VRAKRKPEVTSHTPGSVRKCEGVNPHTPKWIPKLGVGVPKGLPKGLSNLQSAIAGVKTPRLEEFFISLERSWSVNVQNDLACAIWTSAAQVMGKRKAWSQLPVWEKKTPGPEKVGNRPDLLGCRQRATYRWKVLDEIYNFAWDRIYIGGLLAKLWGSKVAGVPVGGISGLPRGSPGTKSHLDVASVESHIVYYKGEGGGFPQVRVVVSLVCPCCPWLVLAPKVLQLCTNHFVWVLCRSMWVSEACQLFLVPSRSSNTPLYPSKCCELGNVPQLLLLPLFFTWAHICVLWGVGSASKSILHD
jgi:hypothetical protein